MKKLFYSIIIALICASCQTLPKTEYKIKALTYAAKPVTVISISKEKTQIFSAVFKDANGVIFIIKNAALESLLPGDIIY